MTFANYPENVNGSESFFASIDTQVIPATCPYDDCSFDGDVEADVFLVAAGRTERTCEYNWSCPTCGAENEETRTYRDGEDDA